MRNSIRFIVSAVLAGLVFLNNVPAALACGPFTLSPVFSLTQHADFPLAEFTGGKTGIVPDSFGNMSLFVFYRELNDLPLTNEEQKQVVEAMETQIFYRSGRFDRYKAPDETPNYFDGWQTARARITAEKRDIETEKHVTGDYQYFSNCLPDAFKSATNTLEARIAEYGNNENIKEWLKGQDAVFSNCSGAAGLPQILDESFPEWLRRDREYQIAAAQFYMSDFPAAREQFEKIAADEKSVWRSAAKFVAARTFIRQSSFVTGAADDDDAAKAQRNELLQKAAERLQNILSDSSMNEFHASALRLLGLVKYRMIPDDRRRELAALLTNSAQNQNIYNDLTDFDWLMDHEFSAAYDRGSALDAREAEKAGRQYDYNYVLKLRDLPAERRTDDLTDWIFTYKAADGFGHAYEKWKETGRLLLDDDKISRTHAMFFLDEDGASVVDLLSTNGTHVNGERITDADLHEGDIVNIGKTRFIVHLVEA
jgi:hypothetical protein